ncbi:unnamed protein product [Rhodiola kirilowii]
MAIPTQASLFTPALNSSDRLVSPWKHQQLSQLTLNPKATKLTRIRAAAAEGKAAEAPTKDAPVGFTPPELDPNTLLRHLRRKHRRAVA